MLALDAVSLALGGRTILDRVSLDLSPGQVTILVGPNGAGKSTILKLLSGELRPDDGTVRLDGRPLATERPEVLAARRAVLPQASALAFPFTVLEVVRLGLDARAGLSPEARRLEPLAALERVDLADFAGRRFQDLSGGEQQRVHLARVLAQTGDPVQDGVPRALLLDEPTSSLDLRHQIGVLSIARGFADAGGLAFAILHDLNLAAAFADRILVLDRGALALDGAPEAILYDSRLAAIFGIALDVQCTSGGRLFVVPCLDRRSIEAGRPRCVGGLASRSSA
jgi:iron complex transport system ATP-binding protein